LQVLELDIRLEWIEKASGVDVHLMLLIEGSSACHVRQEELGVVIDGADLA
jgi:hypothetical protein